MLEKIKNLKFKKRILALAGVAMVLLSGCGTMRQSNNNYNPNNNPVEVDTDMNDDVVAITTASKVNPFTEEEKMILSQSTKNFENFIESIQTNYQDSEYFGIDEILAIDRKVTPVVNHSENVMNLDGTVNRRVFMAKVQQNNKSYLSNNSITSCVEMSQNELNNVCDLVIEVVNKEILENSDIDSKEVGCVLGNLKIFSNKSMVDKGMLTNDLRLVIASNMVGASKSNKSEAEALKKNAIIHEIYHAIQYRCPCYTLPNEVRIGITTEYKDAKVNSLNWTWFYEASAEKNRINHTGDVAVSYRQLIGSLERISLSTILNPNVKPNQTENICMTHDIESLYDQFDAKTAKEKKEITTMMYANEILLTPGEEFLAVRGSMTNQEVNDLVDSLNGSVSETLTKIFYKNLVNSILNKEVSIQDVFSMMKIFELDLYTNIRYGNGSSEKVYPEFITNYTAIQDEFFKLIAPATKYSATELADKFSNYSTKMQDRADSLKWLSKDKRNYIFERQDSYPAYRNPDIRSVTVGGKTR